MKTIRSLSGMAVLMTCFTIMSIAQTNTFPSSGNVGIGITNPGHKLQVIGAIGNATLSPQEDLFQIGGNELGGVGGFVGLKIGGTSDGKYFTYLRAIKTQGYNNYWNTALTFGLTRTNTETTTDEIMRLTSDGNVGIGTQNPRSTMHIEGPGSAQLRFNRTDVPGEYGFEQGGATFGLYDYTNGVYRVRSTGNNVLLNESTGNVLVGKSAQVNPLYKLDVNGFVRADEIRVNTTGADFVFADDYPLRSLPETEKFIREYKHLPEITPAKEMRKEGMDVGVMNIKLLQKIEELTLHLIEKDKEVRQLKERMDRMEALSLKLRR